MSKLTNQERKKLNRAIREMDEGKFYTLAEVEAEIDEIVRVAKAKKKGAHLEKLRRPALATS